MILAAFRNHSLFTLPRAFASKMQASSTQKTKDSAGRRLGLKKFGGEEVYPGDILIRQRGKKYHPGTNTVLGRDHTITALTEGVVVFVRSIWRKRHFYWVNVVNQPISNRKPPMRPYNYHRQLFPQREEWNLSSFGEEDARREITKR